MTFGAATIRGLTGFGMAITLVPLLSLIIAPAEAVVVGILVQVLIGPLGLPKIIADAERKSAYAIAGWAVLATPLGLWLLGITPPDVARLLIALTAIGALLLMLLPSAPGQQPGALETVLTGIACGILTGFAAMPGPPVVPYYVGRDLPRETTKTSMMLIFTIAGGAGLLSGILTGVMALQLTLLSVLLFPAVIAGNRLGERASGAISDPVWPTFVGVVLAGAAVAALVKLL